MSNTNLRIVFLGTPGFAVASLKALVEAEYNIVGVITAPDRRGGRGMKQVIQSDVKKYALAQGLAVLQPTNLKATSFLNELSSLSADLQIVVAFRMLPIAVWDMPRLGTYNLHGSLLPKYRGAAPINWAIMRGEPFTGVTTFKLKHEIDTGSIAFQEKVEILPADYLDTIHDKMMEVGANLVIKTVKAIEGSVIRLIEQDNSGVTKAPKIFQEDCQLDFKECVRSIFNKIRGLSPYPVAWTSMDNKRLKLYKARYSYHMTSIPPGEFITDGKSYLVVTCQDGFVQLDEVKMEGKRRMVIRDFLNGLNLDQITMQNLRIVKGSIFNAL